jgi:hypothetical protein
MAEDHGAHVVEGLDNCGVGIFDYRFLFGFIDSYDEVLLVVGVDEVERGLGLDGRCIPLRDRAGHDAGAG